ncbi:MAG: hypothetical protein PHC34_04260 [Candidatus Gastranaerophilales bacterium]|nr:hypothetical protein [Candidatus Gastranaerophilales bacterium]
MNKVEKIIDRMKRTKYGHTFEDCQKVLEFKCYTMKEGKGSHFKFFKGQKMIVIAKHRPVDPKAVEDIIRAWET